MSSNGNILVCVTQQKNCEKLITKALEIKNKYNSEIFILHVAKNEWLFLDNAKEGEAIEYLFGISKAVGADLSVLKSDDIIGTIIEYVKDKNISTLVMGKSPNDHKENKFYSSLRDAQPFLEIVVIPK